MHNEPNVAILGCGPAGMFAAHAVEDSGGKFSIFSKARKSHMRGAQYLHEPIPGLSGESFDVTYSLWGDVEGYRQKVYGDMGDLLVSPESLLGTAPAWDIREAYDKAWGMYAHAIVDLDFAEMGDPHSLFRSLTDSYDLVVSSIPAPLLCERPAEHGFASQRVWATEGLKRPHEVGFQDVTRPGGHLVDNLVVCSGDPDDWWYRQSRIQGWENTEFPYDRKPSEAAGIKVHEVVKPISNTCTCHSLILRVGRYGKWTKGVLSHEAYGDVMKALA